MSSLERKVKRNELKNLHKNKDIKKEFMLYQCNKYGIDQYAKMQNKSVKKLLEEEI